MKRKSLKFLSVLLSISMILTPVSSTFAESMEVAVEQAVTAQNEAGTSVLDVSENGTEVVADSVEPTPLEEPEAPIEETEAPLEEPEAPLEETETPAEEPEAPLEETETPAEETEPSAEETEPSAEEAETNNIPQQINDEMLPAVVSETDETSIPATSIKFNVSKKTITVGNSYSLKATVKPTDTTDTIKWSSDNATVATVDNGTITGHSTGTAVITAEIGEFKATCTVTVVNTYSVIIQTMLYKGTGAASKDVSDVNVVLQDVNGKNVESTIINNQFKFTDLDAEQKYTLKVTRNDYTLVEKSGNVYTQLSEKEYTATIDKTSDASTYTIIFQKDALTFALREVPSDYSKFQNSTVENLKQVLTSINANETNITVRNDYASKLNAALAGLKLKNGSYTTSAEVSTGMAITDLRIIVEKGSMKAQFIGTPAAYGKIYMGGKSAAKTADDTDPKMILPDNDGAIVKNSAGVEGHQYTMPVSDLATAITFSSYATARNVWTEQTVIFSSGNMDGTVSDDDDSDTIGKSYSLSVNTVIDSTGIGSGMFAMDNAVATKQSDGSWLVRMHQTKENRNYMAITSDKDAATAHSVDWYVSDANYYYTIPVADLTQPLLVTFSSTANVSAGKEFGSIVRMTFDTANMTETSEVSAKESDITILPKVSKDTYTITVNAVMDSTGEASGMYAMDNAVATKQSDGSWLVRMHQTSENRNYMAITSDKDAATAHSVDWYVSDVKYYYTIPVADLTQPLLVTFSSDTRVNQGKGFGNIVRITFDAANMAVTAESPAKESDISILPKVSKDTYTMTVNAVMDSTGEASGMYAMDNAVATKQSDGSWLVRMHQTSENRNYMAITSDKDAATAHSVDWYVSDAKYYYTIPVADLTQPLLVTFSSDTRVNQGKGFGNIVRITFDAANMAVTAESPAKEADVTILSAVSSAPETTPTPVPTQIPAEPEKPADDGKYSITVNSNATMFKIVNCVLTVKDGTYTAKVTLSGTGYDYLYMGTGEAAAADTANWISYTVEASGDFAGKYTFEIPVSALDTPIAVAAHSAKAGTWYDRTMTFDSSTLKFLEGLTPDTTPTPDATVTPTPEVTPTPDTTPVPDTKPTESGESEYVVDSENTTSVVDNSTTVSDGNYAPDSYTWSGGSGKTKIFCQKVTIVNGKAYATIQFSSDAFPQLKANGNIYTGICANGTSTYTIPVTLGKDNTVIGYSTKMKSWITYTVNPVVTESSKEPEITPTPEVTPLPEVTPTPTEKPSDPVKPGEQGNGNYSITVNSNAIMFKVINCVLKVKDGTYTANITLSGTGYDYLFMGTAAQAAASDKANYIGYKVNANGQYVYTIPVSALDKPIAVAGHATKSGEWYDRELTFDSSTMVLLKGDEATATPSPTPTPNPEDDKKADEESKYETDLSGGTSAVDSSTGLADGVYTPDKFSWSGGSGRTNITCSKVTVTGGQAYATIVFGSTSYGYVKANGNVYYPSYGAGTSSFTIPVKLNANNTIIGMTTAMSAAHEVTYTLYIYIAGADKASSSSAGEKLDNNSLSEKAPEIIGLTYMEEAKLEYAEYFKMYYYEDGITLIEIDMSSDTDRPESEDTAEETENTAEEKEATEETASTEDIEESSEEGTEVKDNITAISELYQNKVIRYLLVPEGVEIPVGLDKEMIVVNLSVENVYTDSEEAMDFLKNVGFIEEMEEKEFTLLEGEAGEKPDYKEMILNKIDFAILSDAFLWDEEKEDLTLDEQSELFYEITERLTTLGIPAIVDRSADEKTQEAAAEWIKVYGELFGCRTLAETLFQETTQC